MRTLNDSPMYRCILQNTVDVDKADVSNNVSIITISLKRYR